MTRTCTKCGETKEIEEFPRDRRARDGRASRCKPCRYAAYKVWKRTPGGKAIRVKHQRDRVERKREQIRAHSQEYYQRTKDRYMERLAASAQTPERKARRAVANQIHYHGAKKPTACPRCGEPTPPHRMHAHHHDYSKPLDVEWMCSVCHGIEHRKERAA